MTARRIFATNPRPRALWRGMIVRVVLPLLMLLPNLGAVTTAVNFKDAPHRYLDHVPADRFSLLKKQLESGEVKLDTASDKAFLDSLLKALDIPVSSQLLVFSASSFQSGIINPRNPRALYFNEDT